MRKLFVSIAAVVVGASGCTVHQTDVPSVGGPSTNAITLSVTATPDTIPQDGSAQSRIAIKAFNAGGQPFPSLTIRVDTQLNGTLQDIGTLSSRSVVTAADGTASVLFTAPAGPGATGLGTSVAIVATPVQSDAANTGILNSVGAKFEAYVRLITTGTTSVETPSASFTVTGTQNAGAVLLFNGTASCPNGTSGSSCAAASSTITNWDWDFGDGTPHASGSIVTHAFATSRPFVVTLTVTNSQGGTASTTSTLTIGTGAAPTALFTALPNPVAVGGTVTLDGTPSTGNPNLINYQWSIQSPAGGAPTVTGGSSPTATFTANAAGTWTITLTVTNASGLTASTSHTVTAQ